MASGLLALGAGSAVLIVHAALLLITVAAARRLPRASAPAGAEEQTGVRAGLRFIASHPVVGPLTGAVALHSLTTGAVGGLLTVFADQALGWGQRPALTPLLYASLTLGGLLASIATPRLLPRTSAGGFAVSSAVASLALLLAMVGARAGGEVTIALLVAWQTAASMLALAGITIRQIVTPQPLQGRVGVTGRMIAWGTQPVGALAGGVIASMSDARTAMLALGVGTAASAALLATASVRGTQLRRSIASHLEEVTA